MHCPPPPSIRILTFNIRYATSSPFKGEEPWSIRKPRLLAQLRHETRQHPTALICLQEVLHGQLMDILDGLNESESESDSHSDKATASKEESLASPAWKYIGLGRDDGHQRGEYSPILYRPSTFTLQSHTSLWLSPTPSIPSKGWDAASIRILTIGTFQHTESKKVLAVLNTHLDDQGSKARYEAAKMIIAVAKRLSGVAAIVLTGDFNSLPSEEAYEMLTDLACSPFRDTHALVPERLRYGNQFTFTGFGYEGLPLKRIDHVLVCAPQKNNDEAESHGRDQKMKDGWPWDIKGYGILANRFDDGVFLSDHRAVVVDAVFGVEN